MPREQYAGKAIRSLFSKWMKIKNTEDPDKKTELIFDLEQDIETSYSPEGPNWKIGNRLVSCEDGCRHSYPNSDGWIGFERYAEDQVTKLRLSEIYDFNGNLIGRTYYDQGDILMEDIKKHLTFWASLKNRGRPPIMSPLPFSDEEVYTRVREIMKREQLGKKHGETAHYLENAVGLFMEETQQLTHAPTDEEHDAIYQENIRAYWREESRKKKNSA